MFDVQAKTCLDAWQKAAQLIHDGGHRFNLLTRIEEPTVLLPHWLTDYDPRGVRAGADDIRDVIDTIFPVGIAERAPDRQQLYEMYLKRHQRAMRWTRNRGRWGTYFQRLIDGPNQLERAIQKLQAWPVRNTTGLVFHLSSPLLDAPRTRGGPCWHFGEILWHGEQTLDLVAVYRNHDFFNKALGNFIGLGQLLAFIAKAADKQPGALICHSVHAFSDKPIGALSKLARL